VPQLQILADQLVGKCGLIFTNQSVFELKTIIESNRKESVAKVGTEAPVEVVIQPGSTGMDPSQIGFFHALSISTKINKGTILDERYDRNPEGGQSVGEGTKSGKLRSRPPRQNELKTLLLRNGNPESV
jgi:hypothetical protein